MSTRIEVCMAGPPGSGEGACQRHPWGDAYPEGKGAKPRVANASVNGSRPCATLKTQERPCSRALGSVKVRAGGESPRPDGSQPPVDQVELLDRRSKSGWEEARGSGAF